MIHASHFLFWALVGGVPSPRKCVILSRGEGTPPTKLNDTGFVFFLSLVVIDLT
jgi:hypothetical protein